jgi:hypothetical protein
MLAVIVVQCEQPADPDDGIPFREPKPVGKVTVLVRDHERIKLIDVREDSNRWHISAHCFAMDILGRLMLQALEFSGEDFAERLAV